MPTWLKAAETQRTGRGYYKWSRILSTGLRGKSVIAVESARSCLRPRAPGWERGTENEIAHSADVRLRRVVRSDRDPFRTIFGVRRRRREDRGEEARSRACIIERHRRGRGSRRR